MHGTTLLRSLRNTPANTPLRRLAEEGETDEPHEAAAMLANLLRHHIDQVRMSFTPSVVCIAF